MNEPVTMTVGVAILLSEVTKMLLYKQSGVDKSGKPIYVDRDIPFRLKYRLNKNKMFLDKDVNHFNQKRLLALAKYGVMSEDGNNVIITDDEKRKLFQEEISNLIDSEVTHALSLLDPADIDLVKDTDMPISPEAMSVFISYMVDDPDLREDIKFNVKLSDRRPEMAPEPEKSPADKLPEQKAEIAEAIKHTTKAKKTDTKKVTKTEPKKEVAEEKPVAKKTTTKKTATKKKSETVKEVKEETKPKTAKKKTSTAKKDKTNG